MKTPIEKALWFIESHFARDISLDDVAAVCGLSRFQMSRLFSRGVGMTVTAYLRGRRLSEAARALAGGAPDILAVAIDAGYGSHEAFTRAFRDQFGIGPAELRARGSLDGIALVEPRREDPEIAAHVTPPRLVTRASLLIAGVGRYFPYDDFAGIPALWQELHPHLGSIPGQMGSATYGVVVGAATKRSGPRPERRGARLRGPGLPPVHSKDDGLPGTAVGGERYFYLAGVEVSALSGLDGNLIGLTLPAQRWAVFTHRGHVTTIAATVAAVFGSTLPAAGLAAGDMPDLLEVYGESFDPRTGRGGFEIWVPVKE